VIRTVLQHFTGVPHRTQYIGQINQVKFYNDSKATNILATQMALSGFEPEKVIVLAGGLDRGNSFETLVPSLKNLKAVIVFGETKNRLAQAAKEAGVSIIEETLDVTSALPLAYQLSQAEDVILLSPANASWDQYTNFEVRGEAFIQAYDAL